MITYNGVDEDDYAVMMHKKHVFQRDIENAYEQEMATKEKTMSCEEQLIEQASYYENNCFNTYGR